MHPGVISKYRPVQRALAGMFLQKVLDVLTVDGEQPFVDDIPRGVDLTNTVSIVPSDALYADVAVGLHAKAVHIDFPDQTAGTKT